MAIDKKADEYTTFTYEWHARTYKNIKMIGRKYEPHTSRCE